MTVLFVLLSMLPMHITGTAATQDSLTFQLNADGESYCVTKCDTSASGEMEIPATYEGKPVTAIGERAFYVCTKLTGIAIPKSIQ